MGASLEDLPAQLLRAPFGFLGKIDQSPDFEEDFKALYRACCDVSCWQVLLACLGAVPCKYVS